MAACTPGSWETTPDGREGWQTLFARAGFDVYVIDQPWRGRSAPDLSGLMPGLEPEQPVDPVVLCGMSIAGVFDRGGGRFHASQHRRYAAQLWPDFGLARTAGTAHPAASDPRALPPLLDLIDRLGRAVLVTHSQGADLGWRAALARPEGVAAIFAVEPGVTGPGLDHPEFPEIPVCLLWGDNLPEEGRALTRKDILEARDIAARNGKVTLDLLPEHGIFGNGHMMMMEDNNSALAQRAIAWIHATAAP